jgi:hypothetical protein
MASLVKSDSFVRSKSAANRECGTGNRYSSLGPFVFFFFFFFFLLSCSAAAAAAAAYVSTSGVVTPQRPVRAAE